MRNSLAYSSLLIALVAGCTLIDGGTNHCAVPADEAVTMLVNPATLQCQTFDSQVCNPGCECPNLADEPAAPWGPCDGPCAGLDETSCSANASCRVALSNATDALTDYLGCFALDTNPAATGSCGTLDVDGCATRHDCEAIYGIVSGGQEFVSCVVAS